MCTCDVCKLRQKVVINENKVNALKHLLEEYQVAQEDAQNALNTYQFKKPLTEIELYGMNPELAREFIEKIRHFFFVHIRSGVIIPEDFEDAENGLISYCFYTVYVSRFRTLIDITQQITQQTKLNTEVADLWGLLYGYDLKDIAEFCLSPKPEDIPNTTDRIKQDDDDPNPIPIEELGFNPDPCNIKHDLGEPIEQK